MSNVLITYASMAGSTAKVATTIGEVLEQQGVAVTVQPLAERPAPEGFDAVVLGGPMIMGWHRQSRRYLRRYQDQWTHTPLAVFITAMKLTKVADPMLTGFPFVLDPGIMQLPGNPEGLSLRENYSRPSNYLKPVLRTLEPAKPASAAIFGGRLLYGQLPWWAVPIALLASGGLAGDKRNWELIRSWAAGLPAALDLR